MPITLPVPVSAGDWQDGPAEAPVTLVEYADFQCDDSRAAFPLLKRLREEHAGRLRFVFRHLPLTDEHVYALDAAKAAEAAGALGKFWPMHDALFAGDPNAPQLIRADLLAAAERIGLSEADFLRAFADPGAYAGVRADVDGIRITDIHSTPTLFVNGERYEGKNTYDALSKAISQANKGG
ncbi:MAG TPA: thioredoxin domain-containing protein [Chthonomonadaceae bacterium]|nr:thioredoxin domain-containing protein [Chthonomonadaceae bacterium]